MRKRTFKIEPPFSRGFVYWFKGLPIQPITEVTNGITRTSRGDEWHSPHYALVISANEFNENQEAGVVIIPLTSARENGREKYDSATVKPTWARVLIKEEYAYVLCEQIRYVDARRGAKTFKQELKDFEMRDVEDKLRKLLLLP